MSTEQSYPRESERLQMVRQQIEGRGIGYYKVLQAMRTLPRHFFVPENLQPQAYSDSALPIGDEATISQPYIVALMTSLLLPEPGDRILEIGTGSGYQTALLAVMDTHLYSIDISPSLVDAARRRLEKLNLAQHGHFRVGDGYLGWPEQAPFDKVIISCALTDCPQPIKNQVKPGGKIVAPIGPAHGSQKLTLFTKTSDSHFATNPITDVVFVPLRGPHAN